MEIMLCTIGVYLLTVITSLITQLAVKIREFNNMNNSYYECKNLALYIYRQDFNCAISKLGKTKVFFEFLSLEIKHMLIISFLPIFNILWSAVQFNDEFIIKQTMNENKKLNDMYNVKPIDYSLKIDGANDKISMGILNKSINQINKEDKIKKIDNAKIVANEMLDYICLNSTLSKLQKKTLLKKLKKVYIKDINPIGFPDMRPIYYASDCNDINNQNNIVKSKKL